MPTRVAVGALALAIGLTAPAVAQQPPDLNERVIAWASGRYASPVMCEIDGELVRGVRRVILRPDDSLGREARLTVHFVDMRPDQATRCIDSKGTPQPNILGQLQVKLPGTSHPETASRDFKRAMQRDKGFSLDVSEGTLKLQTVAVPAPDPQIVDYRGGTASLRLVLPATDADRELAPFPSPQKLVLIVERQDRPRIELPLFLASES